MRSAVLVLCIFVQSLLRLYHFIGVGCVRVRVGVRVRVFACVCVCACVRSFLHRHCRECGGSFCAEHSSKRMPLPHKKNDGDMLTQRVCDK